MIVPSSLLADSNVVVIVVVAPAVGEIANGGNDRAIYVSDQSVARGSFPVCVPADSESCSLTTNR